MRVAMSFGVSAPNNLVKVRNVRSLADAVSLYHRTGVFDLRSSDVESYDLASDDVVSAGGVSSLDSRLLDVAGRCEDLLVAASNMMKSDIVRERQLTQIKQPGTAVANGDASPGQSIESS